MADCPSPYYCIEYSDFPSAGDCNGRSRFQSGGKELALLKCGAPDITDPEDAVEIQALIDAGWFVRVTDIAGGLDEPSAITADDPSACGGTVTVTFDRVLSWQDGKVSKLGVQWYNDTKLKVFKAAFLIECEQARWNWVDATTTFTASRTMAQKSGEFQIINGQLTWRSVDDPVPYDYPAVTWP